MPHTELSLEELDKDLKDLQSNKTEGVDEIDLNVIKDISNLIEFPLLYVFKLSLVQGIFPDKLKIARVVPIHLHKMGMKTLFQTTDLFQDFLVYLKCWNESCTIVYMTT